MANNPPHLDHTTRSLYDPEDTLEEELWFLPGAPEDRAPTDIPLPMAGRSRQIRVVDWLPTERIAFYAALREGVWEDGLLLSQVDWAIWRLTSGIEPRDDRYGFLGRHSTEADGLAEVNFFGSPLGVKSSPIFPAIG